MFVKICFLGSLARSIFFLNWKLDRFLILFFKFILSSRIESGIARSRVMEYRDERFYQNRTGNGEFLLVSTHQCSADTLSHVLSFSLPRSGAERNSENFVRKSSTPMGNAFLSKHFFFKIGLGSE